ncbi:MAG: CotH kinase family protein [Planctomycetes bacterium]|nr:CotH kinase family protein [Planctomycetota bacterium]
MDEVTRQADEKLARILDAKQLDRLNQLRLQREGVQALNRDDLARKLGLSEEQREKLRNQPPEAFAPFAPPDVRQQAQADALAVLTDAQRNRFTELQGKEFKFPEQGFGPPGGPGGPGGPGQERKLVAQFDKDSDGRLNREERQAAREFLKSNRGAGGRGFGFGPPGGAPFGPPGGPGFGPPGSPPLGGPGGPGGGRGPGGPGGFGGRRDEAPKPGPKISPDDIKVVSDANLYEPTVLRTLFLEFEDSDWEAELADFNNTDVEIPATVIVDGQKYPNVGVHFRGMSSFMMVGAGSKRSLNLSFDFVDEKQRLYGYKTLNLLNSHEDPTFLHTVLYLNAARKYIPAPKANFVKVAINGESWGVYVNAQQFNKDFLTDNFDNAKGARWKVPGSPGGRGGLEYLGEDIAAYKQRYSLKTKDSDKDWKALIKLCKTLNETPADELEAALEPILDVDGALWFLALENALINSDGYWVRASDYCIYRDDKGKFHIIPHDANETFQPGMGPGMGGPPGGGFLGGLFGGGGRGPGGPPGEGRPPEGRPGGEGRPGERRKGRPDGRGPGGPGGGRPRGGPGGGGLELDPLVGLTDASKPLRSKLLAVPSLKARYLDHVKTIADEWLDWKKLQPVVDQYVSLIDAEIKADTKKLSSYEAFLQTVSAESQPSTGGGRPQMSLRAFADQRRAFLMNHPEIKGK